jgi:hypothetical protein
LRHAYESQQVWQLLEDDQRDIGADDSGNPEEALLSASTGITLSNDPLAVETVTDWWGREWYAYCPQCMDPLLDGVLFDPNDGLIPPTGDAVCYTCKTCSRDFDGPEIEARDLSELLQQGHCVMFWGYANKLTCLSNHIGPFYEVKQSKTSRQMIALDPETRVKAYLGTVRRRPKDKKFFLDHIVEAQLVVGE